MREFFLDSQGRSRRQSEKFGTSLFGKVERDKVSKKIKFGAKNKPTESVEGDNTAV